MDYITIIQGDDTNFLGDQFLVINFNTDIDLSGFTATFSLGEVTLTYGDLSSKNFEIILSDEITSNLVLGKQYGELKLIDTEKRIRTVTSVIPFLVRKGVNEEIKFVNNSLNVSMNINDTTLDIIIETPGIARAEAMRMMEYCNEAKLSSQNSANAAHNTLIQLNSNVSEFYENISNLNTIIDNAYNTCENNITTLNNTRDIALNDVQNLGDAQIELATEQANIATEKTQEVSETYSQAMSDIETAKGNSLNEIDTENSSILNNFENVKNTTLDEFEEKRSNSIDDINNLTTACRESLTEIANENLYKWNLFDVIQKDHILSFEEKQGLEPLGTYVYKNGIAGSRYGYVDFYNQCVSEKEEATESIITLSDVEITVYINQNGHIYYDISDKEVIDNFYNATGIAWFYGVDTENERIFLPRNDWFFQNGGIDTVGKYIEAGLPDHNHIVTAFWWDDSGVAEEGRGRPDYGHHRELATSYASTSNTIYGNSDTVQPKSTKIITYMVVGNTVQTNAITNIIDVTTTENDTIPLFSAHYDNKELDSLCWLKSLGQSNDGKQTYSYAYSKLVKLLNNHNSKVINAEDMLEGVDYSEYFILNQTEQTFILPTRTSERILVARKIATPEDPTWYNWYSDGWLEQGGIINVSVGADEYPVCTLLKPYRDTTYVISNNILQTAATQNWGAGSMSVYTSGKTVTQFQLVSDGVTNCVGYHWKTVGYGEIPKPSDFTNNIHLYFKICNAIQNIELLDAEGFNNNLVNKCDLNLANCTQPYILETYHNGASWYRVYSDGWCEQGGLQSGENIVFLKPYRDTNYSVACTKCCSNINDYAVANLYTQTNTGMYISTTWYNGNYNYRTTYWQTAGYLLEGEY